jgi:hypothetical protein
MPGLTFWTGPVSYELTAGAVVPGTTHKVIECSGATKLPYCKDVSASMLQGSRRLPSLLTKLGVDEGEPIILAAFSAGGRFVRELVTSPEDRAMVRAVMLADATYSDGLDAQGRPTVNQDWVSFGAYCADPGNGTLWVATAGPNANYGKPTGTETLSELLRQVQERVGRPFEPVEGFYGVLPAPLAAWRLGNVVFAGYPLEPLHHGGHVDLARETFSKILVPWLQGGGILPEAGGVGGGGSPWWKVPLALVAVAAGGAGGYALGRHFGG